MRRLPALLFAAAVVAAEDPYRDEEGRFEVRLPAAGWRRMQVAEGMAHIRLHLQADPLREDPEATAEVQVILWPLGATEARRTLQDLMGEWKRGYEAPAGEVRERSEEEGSLGGVACRTAEVRGGSAEAPIQLTWTLARGGRYAFILYARRTRTLAGNDGIEAAIRAMRDSFRVLEAKTAEPPPPEPPKIDPELLKEKKFTVEAQRFECVKPEGVLESLCEKAEGLVLQFDGEREQARLRIRIHAAVDAERKWTLDQYLASIERAFKDQYEERKEPLFDPKFKLPLAKQAVKLELVGKAAVVHRITWILADCRNGVQYRLHVFQSGAPLFDAEIAKFVEGFRPLPKRP